MDKFGRNYQCFIETASGSTLEVTLPFTIEFDITRNTLSSANVCQVRLYNLSPVNRNQIHYNAFSQGPMRAILLKAGYGDTLSTIFNGNITRAWSVREGVNFITQIECYDGGFAFVNGTVDISFPAETPWQVVIETIAGYLPDVKLGTVGNFPGSLSRGNTFSGNPAQILFEITGGAVFVDNGKVNILASDEYIQQFDTVATINAATGLLDTPILEETVARFRMLFEPSLNVGYLVNVDSSTNPIFNRTYKITAVKHRGMISGVVAGEVITEGEFYYSAALDGVVG